MWYYSLFYYKKVQTFNGNDELRDDRQDLGTSMFQHVMATLASKELIGMLRFTKTIKEQRQVVVEVKLFYFNLQSNKYKDLTLL